MMNLRSRGGKIAVGHVDGDALFALGLQAIDQQRQIDIAAGSAELGADPADGGELVFVDHLGVVQQAADQGALPSSTLPQVRKRSSSLCSCCAR